MSSQMWRKVSLAVALLAAVALLSFGFEAQGRRLQGSHQGRAAPGPDGHEQGPKAPAGQTAHTSAAPGPRLASTTAAPVPHPASTTTVPATSPQQKAVLAAAQQVSQLISSSLDLGGTLGGLVRLAFHDAATFNGVSGGADGCVDLTNPQNKGLAPVVASLAPVVLGAKGLLSQADVWALAAGVAIQTAGGPSLSFRAGRVDVASCTGQNNLPDAQLGVAMMESTFVTRLNFTEREATSLIGAHVLGKAVTVNSGYNGKWVPNNAIFSNRFFVDLLGVRWQERSLPAFNGEARTQWNGPRGTLMLNSDVSLAFDTSSGCTSVGGNARGQGSCPRSSNAFSTAVTDFASSNANFNAAFVTAFSKLTALGNSKLSCVMADCSTPTTAR